MKKIILSLILLFPMTGYAHLISITATKPFPSTVVATSRTLATFKITNISSTVTVTAIDKSNFSSESGLFVSYNTCGGPLSPGQFCTMQVAASARAPGQTISGELKIWAKPTADGVQYSIRVAVTSGLPTITLVPVSSGNLPALRDPIVGKNGGKWLILSGSTGNFHDFDGNNFNTSLYVYNPSTAQTYSMLISATNLPVAVKNQLASSDPQFLQDGDTLYIIGGFYNPPNTTTFTTINTITAINVPGMMNAIINNNTNLAPFVAVNTTIPQFKVTGGQIGKIGNDFYLVYGQDCEGSYCAISQVYTNSIYQFTTDPTLSAINIVNTVTHADGDGSGWRRRDYTLAPFTLGNMQTLFAMGGPFTPGSDALVWTNGISIAGDLQSNDRFINQQGNQYLSPHLSMYSASKSMTYVATFSGLSNLYWATWGLVYDNSTPYGNVLDLISSNASGRVEEYVNLQPLCSGRPLASCLYMGLSAEFIPTGNFYDDRYILQLDSLPQTTPTLVGYIYGGLLSPEQDIFGTNSSYATNKVYAVYVVPSGAGAVNWQNVTNLNPGN